MVSAPADKWPGQSLITNAATKGGTAGGPTANV